MLVYNYTGQQMLNLAVGQGGGVNELVSTLGHTTEVSGRLNRTTGQAKGRVGCRHTGQQRFQAG